MKSFLGNFYRHLAIFFWSHCMQCIKICNCFIMWLNQRQRWSELACKYQNNNYTMLQFAWIENRNLLIIWPKQMIKWSWLAVIAHVSYYIMRYLSLPRGLRLEHGVDEHQGPILQNWFCSNKTAVKLRLHFDALFEGLNEFKSTYLQLH